MLSERGLVRLMKDAYKRGYEVVTYSNDGSPTITIKTPFWAVTSLTAEFPRKALGLLVEHVGYVPMDEAIRVQKGAPPQYEIRDVLETALRSTYDQIQSTQPMAARIIPIIYKGHITLFQQTDQQIAAVDSEFLQLIDVGEEPEHRIHSKTLSVWRGANGDLAIICGLDLSADPHLTHLEMIDWSGQGEQ